MGKNRAHQNVLTFCQRDYLYSLHRADQQPTLGSLSSGQTSPHFELNECINSLPYSNGPLTVTVARLLTAAATSRTKGEPSASLQAAGSLPLRRRMCMAMRVNCCLRKDMLVWMMSTPSRTATVAWRTTTTTTTTPVTQGLNC